mmetsp:Transcript_37942/g.91987  ORF Transcript_37942/g.91987 Transcript_37942/m.91987 type:complete len:131 (+) Transcript_37942:68-460(+)
MNSTEPGDHLRTPLRRASYVHVSDLTSAYNIDHGLLEQELNRTNSDSKTEITDRRASDTDNQVDPNSVAVDLDVSLATTSQKRLQPPRGGFNLCVCVTFLFGRCEQVLSDFFVLFSGLLEMSMSWWTSVA